MKYLRCSNRRTLGRKIAGVALAKYLIFFVAIFGNLTFALDLWMPGSKFMLVVPDSFEVRTLATNTCGDGSEVEDTSLHLSVEVSCLNYNELPGQKVGEMRASTTIQKIEESLYTVYFGAKHQVISKRSFELGNLTWLELQVVHEPSSTPGELEFCYFLLSVFLLSLDQGVQRWAKIRVPYQNLEASRTLIGEIARSFKLAE
jgi:hypothetical protein